jgi:Ser/Thr protein kinase RdoA (MazF antagonist)
VIDAAAWPALLHCVLTPLPGGLINTTWVASDGAGPRGVVQKLHPVFGPNVNLDIDVVTAHLARKGLPTPRVLRTNTGGLYVLAGPDCYRALSFVPGRTVDTVESPRRAWEAGALVGRFHAAVADLDWEFQHVRKGAHDTALHMTNLAAAVEDRRGHRLFEAVAPLADAILSLWRGLSMRELPPHVAHGDLKISNLRFDDEGVGICLLDLDTLARMPLDVEMGDALRSWCNPLGEDVEDAAFDAARYEAAVAGWRGACPVADEVVDALLPGAVRIAVELASRFARDALLESYFGWDPTRFPTRGDHCLLRARGQLSVARAALSVLEGR